jgi:hypothetical protein
MFHSEISELVTPCMHFYKNMYGSNPSFFLALTGRYLFFLRLVLEGSLMQLVCMCCPFSVISSFSVTESQKNLEPFFFR